MVGWPVTGGINSYSLCRVLRWMRLLLGPQLAGLLLGVQISVSPPSSLSVWDCLWDHGWAFGDGHGVASRAKVGSVVSGAVTGVIDGVVPARSTVLVVWPWTSGAGAMSIGWWSCSWVCSQVCIQQACYQGMGMPSQRVFPWPWALLACCTFLLGIWCSHSGTFVHRWLPKEYFYGELRAGGSSILSSC